MTPAPELSVVIPVYNEEAGLPALFARLYPALDALGAQLRDHLRQRRQPRPLGRAAARAVRAAPGRHARGPVHRQLRPAHGDHRRLRALPRPLRRHARRRPAESAGGDRHACSPRWTRATTTSAPSARSARTSAWRRYASRLMNRLRERITRIHMTDQGCMLRAYAAHIVDADQPVRARSTPSSRRSPTPSAQQPDRDRGRARGARRRRVEVFAATS